MYTKLTLTFLEYQIRNKRLPGIRTPHTQIRIKYMFFPASPLKLYPSSFKNFHTDGFTDKAQK